VPPRVDSRIELEAAHALVAAGCLDCLTEAYERYEKLRPDAIVGDAARAALVRTAVLIALREHELGMIPTERLAAGRRLLTLLPASQELADLLEVADAIISGPSGPMRTVTLEAQTLALVNLSRNQNRWADSLRARMPDDRVATYLWLSLACGIYGSQVPDSNDRTPAVGAALSVPLVGFKDAIGCARNRAEALNAIREAEPRFLETHFFLGMAALSGQSRVGAPGLPDLEAADAEFRLAYQWRQDWPSLTLMIANLALTFEDFLRAFEFFEKTLTLLPHHPEALLGKIRALTYLQRHAEAIVVADDMLATGINQGDARYWRALNQEQLDQHDQAWDDVELADKLLINADVPKLAGIIAINRRQLDAAKQKLELSLKRRSNDCEVRYYLQIVRSEQRDWTRAAADAAACATCFDKEEVTLHDEIERFRLSKLPPERRDRQIARREQQLAANTRMRANAWFNAAAANFNLGRKDEARVFAEKLIEDMQFAGRAKELLLRLTGTSGIRN
jgi:tetratricopeptide (TPR) repeat protein